MRFAMPRTASPTPVQSSLAGGSMRLTWCGSSRLCLSGAAIVALVSCSEPTTTSSPVSRRIGPAEANVVGSFGAPAGSLQTTISSGDASVHYCGYDATVIPILATFSLADCATAPANLTGPLTTYTPTGWTCLLYTSPSPRDRQK